MRVADYILDYLVSKGIKHVFGVTGGVITPLFDAFHGRKDIEIVCTQTEQAAAMAADGYARFNGLGVCLATSGPGATNLLTGIGCSYFDSIPVLCITGNVNTAEAKGDSGVRQRGFQETDIVSIVKPITKYAKQINDIDEVEKELEIALSIASTGRPGPVLLDIPINIQMSELKPNDDYVNHSGYKYDTFINTDSALELIYKAKRPIIIYGNGARKYQKDLIKFIEASGIPCLPSWAALDMVPHDHPQYVGTFGVYGSRYGNWTVQNSDLIIAVGTRLDGRMTGAKGFAPKAKLVMVDIDQAELDKFPDALKINADVGDFLKEINARGIVYKVYPDWYNRINGWKFEYTPVVKAGNSRDQIHPQYFVKELNELLPDDAIVVADSGANLSHVQQAIKIRGSQRLFSAYGYSPMGYAVPAAIGAFYATGRPVVAICGDGAFQMNIQELQTLAHYQIPVKVFIFNNHSYGIIKQFQDELFEGRYIATDYYGGYSVPNFQRIVEGYKIKCYHILNNSAVKWMTKQALESLQPFVCDVELDQSVKIVPKTRYGNPLENQWPELDPDIIAGIMNDTD